MTERKEYPRPQFRRESWQNLNGKWEFAFDDNNEGKTFGWWKGDKKLGQQIIVPFSYQYPASGINDKAIHDVTWYRRTFEIVKENAGKRALLCFNAADYETDVWVNGIHAINHKGGFAPLSVITERKVDKGSVILVGSVLSQGDILRLVDRAPIAEASGNIILTERTGEQNGIIAVETENKSGYVILKGEYIDLITGKTFSEKIEFQPYQVRVMKKI